MSLENIQATEEEIAAPQDPLVSKEDRLAYLNAKFEKPEPVYNDTFSKSFPGSIIVKKIDGTHFAVRRTANGWEGNSFKVLPEGGIGATYQERNIDPEIIASAEAIEAMTIPVLNRDLMKIGSAQPEAKEAFVNEKKNLPPEATIDLYHGLNGGLDKALGVLESEEHGIKQISGPCLAAYPVGQFWKPGDAGFKYSVPRGLIEFPGENVPEAKFRMDKGGIVYMINGLTTLPATEYGGTVMRTERKRDIQEEKLVDGYLENVVVGEEVVSLTPAERMKSEAVQKKLKELRSANSSA